MVLNELQPMVPPLRNKSLSKIIPRVVLKTWTRLVIGSRFDHHIVLPNRIRSPISPTSERMPLERNDRDYVVSGVEPLSENRERFLCFAQYSYQRDAELLTGSCYVDRLVVRSRISFRHYLVFR